jgi:hypothetical protein
LLAAAAMHLHMKMHPNLWHVQRHARTILQEIQLKTSYNAMLLVGSHHHLSLYLKKQALCTARMFTWACLQAQ